MEYQSSLSMKILLFLLIIFLNIQICGAEEFSYLQENLYKWFQIDDPYYLEEYNTILYSGKMLSDVYKNNNYEPLWITDMGVKRVTRDFIAVLQKAGIEGLFPGEYNLSLIKYCLLQVTGEENNSQIDKINTFIHTELLLTDAFFIYASDVINGRLSADKRERVWVKENDKIDLKTLLTKVIRENDIDQLDNPVSRLPEYKYLKTMLARYREIEEKGSWPVLESNVALEMGDSGKEVEILHKRLEGEPGKLADFGEKDRQIFDRELQKAIFNFQKRYGLVLTGKVDKDTRKALKLSSGEIVDKIIINLERLRHLNQDPRGTYVIVNIPEFKLEFIEKGERMWEEKVIVGTLKRKTPVFSTRITGLLFNPRWYIPHSIAVKDFLPRLKEDLSYLEKKNIRIYEENNGSFQEISPESVDWEKIDKDNFDYYLWQDSGPGNALGKVIFRSPNEKHIYIHDTSKKYLFNYHVRTHSSGCVRVQNALKIAEYFVENYTGNSREDMEEVLAEGKEEQFILEKNIPLHFVYLTARANKEKEIRFSEDIYGKDAEMKKLFF